MEKQKHENKVADGVEVEGKLTSEQQKNEINIEDNKSARSTSIGFLDQFKFEILFTVPMLLSTIIFLPKTVEKLPIILKDQNGKILVAFLIVGIGYSLFLFKKNQQFWYGIFETIFAIYSCFVVIELIEKNLTDEYSIEKYAQLATYAAIGSTLYLVVRGIANIVDGFKSNDVYFKKYLPVKTLDSGEVVLNKWLQILISLIIFILTIYFFLQADYFQILLIIIWLIVTVPKRIFGLLKEKTAATKSE